MIKRILINREDTEVRVAFLEDTELVEIHTEPIDEKSIVGNIYKGVVQDVKPGLQAAFIDCGLERNMFLHFMDIRPESLVLGEDDPIAAMREAGREPTPGTIHRPGRRPRQDPSRPQGEPPVQRGDEIIVQVVKEEIGGKAPRVTANISIPGRYLVLLPFPSQQGGVSRKIALGEDRYRLKKLLASIRSEDVSFIVRTAGVGQPEDAVMKDVDQLTETWGQVLERYRDLKGPGLLFDEHDIVGRLVRDAFPTDIDEIWVDSRDVMDELRVRLRDHLPEKVNCLRFYDGIENLLDHFGVEKQIERATQRKIWLKSGGFLVIDENEALTSIDVNTGRFTGRKDQERTSLLTNLEACETIANQIRLRDIGGIIVIDFIDMLSRENQNQVYEELRYRLKRDRAKLTVGRIGDFGVLTLTRKRQKSSLLAHTNNTCPYCNGSGLVLKPEQIYRRLKYAIRQIVLDGPKKVSGVLISVNPEFMASLQCRLAPALSRLKRDLKVQLFLKADVGLHVEAYLLTPVLKPTARTFRADARRPEDAVRPAVETLDNYGEADLVAVPDEPVPMVADDSDDQPQSHRGHAGDRYAYPAQLEDEEGRYAEVADEAEGDADAPPSAPHRPSPAVPPMLESADRGNRRRRRRGRRDRDERPNQRGAKMPARDPQLAAEDELFERAMGGAVPDATSADAAFDPADEEQEVDAAASAEGTESGAEAGDDFADGDDDGEDETDPQSPGTPGQPGQQQGGGRRRRRRGSRGGRRNKRRREGELQEVGTTPNQPGAILPPVPAPPVAEAPPPQQPPTAPAPKPVISSLLPTRPARPARQEAASAPPVTGVQITYPRPAQTTPAAPAAPAASAAVTPVSLPVVKLPAAKPAEPPADQGPTKVVQLYPKAPTLPPALPSVPKTAAKPADVAPPTAGTGVVQVYPKPAPGSALPKATPAPVRLPVAKPAPVVPPPPSAATPITLVDMPKAAPAVPAATEESKRPPRPPRPMRPARSTDDAPQAAPAAVAAAPVVNPTPAAARPPRPPRPPRAAAAAVVAAPVAPTPEAAATPAQPEPPPAPTPVAEPVAAPTAIDPGSGVQGELPIVVEEAAPPAKPARRKAASTAAKPKAASAKATPAKAAPAAKEKATTKAKAKPAKASAAPEPKAAATKKAPARRAPAAQAAPEPAPKKAPAKGRKKAAEPAAPAAKATKKTAAAKPRSKKA